MKQTLIAFLFFVMLSQTVYAETSFRGEVKLVEEYFSGRASDESGLYGEINLNLKIEDDQERYAIILNPKLRGDTWNLSALEPIRDRERPVLFPYEMYLEFGVGNSLLAGAGYKNHFLGQGEEINPSESTPVDYLNPMEPDRFGVLSAWAELRLFSGFYLKGIAFESTRSIMPLKEGNPWRLPQLDGVVIGEASLPNTPNLTAVLGWEGLGANFSLSYSHGYGGFPELSLQKSNTLVPEYFKSNLFGLNVYKDVWNFGLKLEAGYRKSDTHQDDYVQYVLGVDRLKTWGRSRLYVLLQYVREEVVEEGDNPFQGLDLSRALKDTLTTKVEYKHGRFGLDLRGAYELDREGYYIQPKVRYNWESLEFFIGCDFIGGPDEDSFLGSYKKNDKRLSGGVIIHF